MPSASSALNMSITPVKMNRAKPAMENKNLHIIEIFI
jgi:hypothetical protein